jgi:hypothetical protein
MLRSYAIRHIAAAEHDAGDLDAAVRDFTESLRLREATGWIPGIAAAQLALADALTAAGRATLEQLGAERFLTRT